MAILFILMLIFFSQKLVEILGAAVEGNIPTNLVVSLLWLLHHVPNVLSERVLLIGCGKERELDERQYKQIIQKTINTLNE
ncbi:M17 family peptidase N-terminal domain-containing protein, partial [Proteus mirabilis]|uniref:M17 family peptidase N-terminal domain-containing protein n=1 Tax=Proteus mirabilis TaxID=584 RepID=UPI001EF3F68D